MKKHLKRNPSSDSSGTDADVISQIGQIRKQLEGIEKKIDSLLNQPHPKQYPRKTTPHLTQTTCAACHKECKLPFKPTGNRPVYCSDCYSKQKQDDFSNNDKHFDKKKKGNFAQYFNKKNNRTKGQRS